MWHHDTLKSCKVEIGVGHIELNAEGVVVSPSPYALDVLRRYGNVTGFTFSEETPVTQDTTSESADAPNEAKPKRRRTARKAAKD